jgi:hypothetical protein
MMKMINTLEFIEQVLIAQLGADSVDRESFAQAKLHDFITRVEGPWFEAHYDKIAPGVSLERFFKILLGPRHGILIQRAGKFAIVFPPSERPTE